jgi:hypothetical protein
VRWKRRANPAITGSRQGDHGHASRPRYRPQGHRGGRGHRRRVFEPLAADTKQLVAMFRRSFKPTNEPKLRKIAKKNSPTKLKRPAISRI